MAFAAMLPETIAVASHSLHHIPYLPFIHLRGDERDSLCEDVVRGLRAEHKFLLPKYLYDKRGSELFEQITELPEYYLTRAEQEIIDRYAGDIIENVQQDCWLLELGAGSGKKTRRLLQALEERSKNQTANTKRVDAVDILYVPIDISEEFLRESCARLQAEFPAIPMQAVCADFLQGVEYVVAERNIAGSQAQLLVYFPGSTIGNLTRSEAATFFADLRRLLRKGDILLLAADMSAGETKSVETLHAAYNDAEGVTAAFNLNILHRLSGELSARISLEYYKHVAFYNESESRVELYLESTTYNTFEIGGTRVAVAAGERIHTEYSHKFDTTMLETLASTTGFALETAWQDSRRYFSVYLFFATDTALTEETL
jgi:dimethylhistidine N-methyltransferase